MGLFIKGLDTIQSVQTIRSNVLALIASGTTTTEYTVGSNNFRAEFTMPPEEILRECNEFLLRELMGISSNRRTRPFIVG